MEDLPVLLLLYACLQALVCSANKPSERDKVQRKVSGFADLSLNSSSVRKTSLATTRTGSGVQEVFLVTFPNQTPGMWETITIIKNVVNI